MTDFLKDCVEEVFTKEKDRCIAMRSISVNHFLAGDKGWEYNFSR